MFDFKHTGRPAERLLALPGPFTSFNLSIQDKDSPLQKALISWLQYVGAHQKIVLFSIGIFLLKTTPSICVSHLLVPQQQYLLHNLAKNWENLESILSSENQFESNCFQIFGRSM